DFSGQNAGLDGGTYGNRLVRIDVLPRLAPEEILDILLHQRHARLAADEDDLCDVAGGDARILERSAAGRDGLLHQILDQRLELRPGQLDIEVLRPRRIGRDVRQVDVGLLGGGELDLALLSSLFQALHGQRVLAYV